MLRPAEDCLQVLAPQPLELAPADLEQRLGLLLECLREQRVLLVLDNLESLLLEGEVRGHLRPGYEGYAGCCGRWPKRHTRVACCSPPGETRRAAGPGRPPHAGALLASGRALEAAACEQLLAEHELVGSPQERARL